MPSTEFLLTLSCPDRVGIVHAVAAYLHQAGCNVLDSQQFGDRVDQGSERFFMRVHLETVAGSPATYEYLHGGFAPVAAGPLRTMAAKSIPGFDRFEDVWGTRAPLGWNITDPEPTARACVALLSDWFPATTGEIVHVDGGVHAVGA